jgi:RimJ/RimL family protein N-acetyltransferase
VRYPSEWECDITLDDGRCVHVRPIRRDDAPRLRALYERLSPESLYYRFFSPVPPPTDRQLRALTAVDYHHRMAVVATVDDDVVGVARYDRARDDPTTAEVAVIVQDNIQGHGLGTSLMFRLAEAARARGVARFAATVLPENQRVLGMFERAFDVEHELVDGNIALEFPIDPSLPSM